MVRRMDPPGPCDPIVGCPPQPHKTVERRKALGSGTRRQCTIGATTAWSPLSTPPRGHPQAAPHVRCRRRWQTVPVDDEKLLAQAEQALTEIKVNHGLSDRHASVLAALRIRLKGSAGKSLEEMLAAAGDLKPGLEEQLAKAESERKPSLDDLLSERKPKPDRPS